MIDIRNDSIDIKQERRMIDAVEWGAHELRDEFLEKIRECFLPEEKAENFIESWMIKIKYLNHISENIMNALKQEKQTSVEWDTTTIEVTMQDHLIWLLYDRRTEFNHSEITYIIFKEELKKLKTEILKSGM